MSQFRIRQLTPWLGEKYLTVADVLRIPSRRFKNGYEYVSYANVLTVAVDGDKLFLTIRYGSPARHKDVSFRLGHRTQECYDLIMAKFAEDREAVQVASAAIDR